MIGERFIRDHLNDLPAALVCKHQTLSEEFRKEFMHKVLKP